MEKIGIVLAGAASKGVYEMGAMRAIEDYFGLEAIRCVSSASSGMLVAQTYGLGRSDDFARLWKGLGKRPGSCFLSFPSPVMRKFSAGYAMFVPVIKSLRMSIM